MTQSYISGSSGWLECSSYCADWPVTSLYLVRDDKDNKRMGGGMDGLYFDPWANQTQCEQCFIPFRSHFTPAWHPQILRCSVQFDASTALRSLLFTSAFTSWLTGAFDLM